MKSAIIYKGVKNLFSSRNNFASFLNFFGNYLWALLRIPSFVPLPLEMQIEPSSVCNLSCKMCNVRENQDLKGGLLKKNLFEKLLGEFRNLKSINFTGMGEGLVNKDLSGLIEIAKEKKIGTMFITNAQLLNLKNIDLLIKSGLDKICISMESGEPSSYEKFRLGAKFEILKWNVELLNKVIKKSKCNLQVVINTVLLSHNLKNPIHLEKIIDFAYVNDIKLITLQFPHDVFTFGLENYFGKDKNKLIKIFDFLKNYSEERGITISFPSLDVKKGSCYYPWVYPQVTAGGELLPCCIISQFGSYKEIIKEFSFGNVFEKSFWEAWNSSKAVLFRRSLQKGKPNEYCRRCSKYQGIL